MRALVAIETALIVLLSVLVCGLLRSHAEILRTLHRMRVGPEHDLSPVHLRGLKEGGQAHDLTGVTPEGDGVHIGMNGSHATLLAFLSSGCSSCQPLWDGLRRGEPRLPELTRTVAVTRGPGRESAGRLRPLTSPELAVVMSDAAWADYAVPGSPYVVYVDNGRISGQGSVQDWNQLASLLARARTDGPSAGNGVGRADEADAGSGALRPAVGQQS